MIRFIHLADVHLGAAPDRGFPWSSQREEEIWETFRRVIAAVRRDPVDLLFIAGDLFHRQPLLRELKEVNYLFSTIPDTKVFLMAGNHDYMKPGSFYQDFSWSSNVMFFREEALTCVKAGELDVYVYGMSYHHREITEGIYDRLRPIDKAGVHVLLAHGGDEKHIPMDMRALAGAGFDYVALGHIHKPQVIRKNMIYPGALEPIDRNELGAHGYVAGSFESGTMTTEFVPFACRSYQQILLPVREDTTQYALEEMLRMDIMKKGVKNIYRVVLNGVCAPDFLLLPEKLKALGNVIEIQDDSRPGYDLEALLKRYDGTLIGDYIRCFTEKTCTAVEEKALYHGLQALLETSR